MGKGLDKVLKRAAARLSDMVKTDADFMLRVQHIGRCMQKEELMKVFLNLRMEKDPDQVFRVLQLESELCGAVKS